MFMKIPVTPIISNLKYRIMERSIVDCFIKKDFVGSSYFINNYNVNIKYLINIL